MEKLSRRQLERYSRTISLKEIGEEGQIKLLESRFLIVGAGGLASSAILYLTSLGVGTVGVVDFDKVSPDNLPRQVLYKESELGKTKVDLIEEKFGKRNPDTKVIAFNERLTKENAKEIIKDFDIVLDCVDNFETEFILNDACKAKKIPLVIAGVSGFKGQVMLVTSESKKDFRSLFSEKSFDISEEDIKKDKPVFPFTVSLISNIQCLEAIKYFLDFGDHLIDEMLVVDALSMKFEKFKI